MPYKNLSQKYFTKELTFSPQVVYNIFIKNEKKIVILQTNRVW